MAKKEAKPYSKINLLSRKEKDKRNMEFMKDRVSEGKSYSFIKKSNKPMELPSGKVATRRGTQISGTSTTVIKKEPTVSQPPHMTIHRGKTTKTYEPADVRTGHKAYGKESSTKPTPEFIKKAQSEKKDIVHKNGLPYRAGYTKTHTEPDRVTSTISHSPGKLSMEKKEVYKSQAPVASSGNSGSLPKRKMPRVEWLRNKDSKGGISPERRRKKTESGY